MTPNRMRALAFIRQYFPERVAIWVEDMGNHGKYVICHTSNGERHPIASCWYDPETTHVHTHRLTREEQLAVTAYGNLQRDGDI